MLKKLFVFAGAILLSACGNLFKVQEPPAADVNLSQRTITQRADFIDEQEELSYALGFYFGNQIRLFDDLDLEVLMIGISQSYQGEQSVVAEDEMAQLLLAKQRQALEKSNQEARVRGDAFLAENADNEGVVRLDNGIQYEILVAGDGRKPLLEDMVEVHYKGTLLDGTVFDSSYDRNQTAVFPLDGVIEGWRQILPLMPIGSLWRVVIPSELAYGESGSGPIGPNEVLIFEINLLGIKDQ